MKRSSLSGILIVSVVIFFGVSFVSHASIVKGDTNHVVISQIQINGTNATDEFVELYNPTSNPVNMSGWRLAKEPQTATTSSNLVASMSGTIKAHGYFLITSQTSSSSNSADLKYSTTNSVAVNNTVILYSNAGITRVDTVGIGTATDSETSPFSANPTAGQSIVRKANASSTATSLMSGGADQFAGNGEDTDNNSQDFVLFSTSAPRNNASPIEPPFVTNTPTPTISLTPTPTATVTPSLTPSVSPSETPSVTPSVIPSSTPTPTITPSVTPSSTPTPSMTPSPTVTVTPIPTVTVIPSMTPSVTPTLSVTPTPSLVVSPTATPSVTPVLSPTPTPIFRPFPSFHLACTTQFFTFQIFTTKIQFPIITCGLVSN